MGDVALTLPVVRSIAARGISLLILSKQPFAEFYKNIENVSVFAVDVKGRHKGLKGLLKLYFELNRLYRISLVIDLHNVLRSRILGLLYKLTGMKVYRIDKGRKEKLEFIRTGEDKGLPHTVDRYFKVFSEAGMKPDKMVIPSFIISEHARQDAMQIIGTDRNTGEKLIGIAPFAKHASKSWGLNNMKQLMSLLNKDFSVSFFLFGGREDVRELNLLKNSFSNCLIVAGKYNLEIELAVLSELDLVISMDSSNMHMAALSGISTVSIWGGTHEAMGFAPLGDQEHIIAGLAGDDLDCRPCTVYGNAGCKRKDIKYKCLKDISPEMLAKKVSTLLSALE